MEKGFSASDDAIHDIARLVGGSPTGPHGERAFANLVRRAQRAAPDLAPQGLTDDVVQRALEILVRGDRFAGPRGRRPTSTR